MKSIEKNPKMGNGKIEKTIDNLIFKNLLPRHESIILVELDHEFINNPDLDREVREFRVICLEQELKNAIS